MKFLPAAAILIPFAAVGEPAPEQTTLRLFEQAEGPVLPVSRRLYSTRFDATRTRKIAVEVSGTAPLTCTLTRPDGTTESQGATLLWGAAGDEDWETGSYSIECLAGEESVGKVAFEIARSPPEVADGDIRIAAVRVFPVEAQLPARASRKYTAVLAADSTRKIGIELEFTHAPLGRSVKVPVECYFFWPDGQTSPPVILSYEPEPTWAGGYSAGAMGWEQAGNWPVGVYTIACSIYGQPVIVDRFDVN
jgi:hypothetical protein